MKAKRVVVTGMGALTPIGNSVDEFWKNSLTGKSGAAPISCFDSSRSRTTFAGELKNFEVKDYLNRMEIQKTDKFAQYGLIAAEMAIVDSGIDLQNISPYECGVIWGTGQGGLITFGKEVSRYTLDGYNPRFSPFFVPKTIHNIPTGLIAIKFGFKGINYTPCAACATSNIALANSFDNIRWGKAKMIITGGSEAPLSEACIGGFNSLHAMSVRNDAPEKASRPFDVDRDGFMMSEGAGALILEEYEHAKARGAKIYAEIVGSGITSDAHHMVAPDPDGISSTQAIKLALEDADLQPEQIDYINAHATSTPVGDVSEIKAISNVFGEDADLVISATKSMTGHLLGAAGAVEAISVIQSMNESLIPPTINLENPDPAISASLNIAREAVKKDIKYALSNAFGFGGHNAILVFKKFEE